VKEEFLNAVSRGDLERMEELLSLDPKLAASADKNGTSAILLAVYHRQLAAAEALQRALQLAGIELNIFEAAALGRTERAAALVQADPALIDAYAPDGFYPLGLAIFFGHPEAARWLIEHGADVKMAARNPTMVQPLHAAASARQLEAAALLVERGADVNAKQQKGFTPLHAAAGNGDIEFARLLLAHGARKDTPCDSGKTPLDYAREHGREEMVELLRG
jgi:ankyrin repeat protein